MYTRKALLDTAAEFRNLARTLRMLQHDEECPVYLKRSLAQTRHFLGTAYGSLKLAAERARHDPQESTASDLCRYVDQIQAQYKFTDLRGYDRAQAADQARAALIYLLCHDYGFSTTAVSAALNRDERAVSKSLARARRDLQAALDKHQTNDVSRYVDQMRSVLKGGQARAV